MRDLTIGIIGGTGRMGQWLKRFFEDAGYRTLIAGRYTSLTPLELSEKSDVVVLSIPIDAARNIIAQIGPHVKKDSLLMDISSLKTRVMEYMLNYSGSSVIGTHPLFGPDTESVRDHTVIICPGRGDEWLTWLSDLLKERGAKVKITTPEEHDRMMSIVQGLTHLGTIALAHTMKLLNVNIGETMEYATPVYELKMAIVARLFAQNLPLYTDLEILNPYVEEVATTYLRSVREIVKMIEEQDTHRFTEYLGTIGSFVESNLPRTALKSIS